jgi:hypothetical protein
MSNGRLIAANKIIFALNANALQRRRWEIGFSANSLRKLNLQFVTYYEPRLILAIVRVVV